MKIGVYCGHVGSGGLQPSGQHGGGELHTFAFLDILNRYYDVTAVLNNGVYPAFDQAGEYGLDLYNINWKPIGDTVDWLRQFDVLMSINHGIMLPAIARRNILTVFFPQHPNWDVSGFDTIIANSNYTAKWINAYWGRQADVVYPPINLDNIYSTKGLKKKKRIVCVGRFFEVPFGNNKNHMTILRTFQEMMRPDIELIFIGAIQNQAYFERIKEAAGPDERVKFLHDLSRRDYLTILGESLFVWAATGYEAAKPSAKEHFGIFVTEAMSLGTIPIVHASGGSPESGCLTWEVPKDLIQTTVGLMEDFEELEKTSMEMIGKAERFGMEQIEKDLISVIEKPLIIDNEENQFKIFLPELEPNGTKIGMITDAPISTGFGTVTHSLARRFLNMGYRVAILGMQAPHIGQPKLTPEDMEHIIRDELMGWVGDLNQKGNKDTVISKMMNKIRDIEPATIWRGCSHDPGAWDHIDRFLSIEKPDVIYLNYDPGNVRTQIDRLRQAGCDKPLIVYLPIEGKPVIPQYIELLRLVRILNGQTILYNRWAVDAVLEAGGPRCKYARHGADHSSFREINPQQRKKLRFAAGWQDKIVLMAVGRNKRTKGFGTLIQVAKILKNRGHDQFIWYFHTSATDTMANSSMPLDQMIYINDLSDTIILAPDLQNQLAGVPYDTPIDRGEVPNTDDIKKVWAFNLSTTSMIERYNMADIYINASELEGFGLTPLEAAGCGLPIISIDDEGVIREVLGSAPVYVPIKHRDPTWHTGAYLSQADPEDFAQAIIDVAGDEQLMAELKQASLKQWAKYKWDDTAEIISKAILEQIQ